MQLMKATWFASHFLPYMRKGINEAFLVNMDSNLAGVVQNSHFAD